MIRAWKEIERLVLVNATHRKGFSLADVNAPFIMGRAMEEFKELLLEPKDPEEMSDLLAVLIHYCIYNGWSMDQIEQLLLDKLKVRFVEPNMKAGFKPSRRIPAKR